MSTIHLLKHQSSFLQSRHKFAALIGGIGSGKSFAGSHFAINRIWKCPQGLGLVGANSYKQLRRATLSCLRRELDVLGIQHSYNQNEGMLTVGKTKILCVTMDNYEDLRGIEIGWFWLDEIRDMKQEAFEVIMGRLRQPGVKDYYGRVTTSPKGYNWIFDYFVGEKKTKEFEIITAESSDNIHLPRGYIETLANNYDQKLYQQEVKGEFVNVQTGQIYYAFNREHNVKKTPIKRTKEGFPLPIKVGMDFNVNPMTCVITQLYNDTVHVIDEIHLPDSNTPQMAKELKRRYGKTSIVADSTGNKRQTVVTGGVSDHQILRDHGHRIESFINPFRMDRYNCVNNLLDKKRIIIDPKCKHLIKDLERVSYKQGTNLPDTIDQSLTHLSDGLGYLCYFAYPLRNNKIHVQRYL